jgi:hypothetical protein
MVALKILTDTFLAPISVVMQAKVSDAEKIADEFSEVFEED